MSAITGIDVRYPIGGLFTALGLVIGGYGIATAGDARMYAHIDGLNVNLWWGIVMLVFGLFMLGVARMSDTGPTNRPATSSPEGRATEQREVRSGLERGPDQAQLP